MLAWRILLAAVESSSPSTDPRNRARMASSASRSARRDGNRRTFRSIDPSTVRGEKTLALGSSLERQISEGHPWRAARSDDVPAPASSEWCLWSGLQAWFQGLAPGLESCVRNVEEHPECW